MSKTLFWHPGIHEFFDEELYFFVCTISNYEHGHFQKEFCDWMHNRGLRGFRVYTVFGDATLILRVWLPEGDWAGFVSEFRKQFTAENIIRFEVSNVPHHWMWQKRWGAVAESLLSGLDEARVRRIQANEGNDAKWAEENGLITYQDVDTFRDNRAYIRFFTFLNGTAGGLEHHDGRLAREIVRLALEVEKENLICRSSIYLGDGGLGSVLVRAEAPAAHYYEIYTFIKRLMSIQGGESTTYLSANDDPIVSDEIGEAAFKPLRLKNIDQGVKFFFPGVYKQEVADTKQRSAVEHIVRSHVMTPDGLANPYVAPEVTKGIEVALIAAANKDEEAFITAMLSRIIKAEVLLRKSLIPLVGQLYPDRVPEKRLAEIAGETVGRMASLGDYLAACLELFKAARRDGVALPDGIENHFARYQEWTQLRNAITHGGNMKQQKGSFDFDLHWQDLLIAFIDFSLRFRAVESDISSLLKAPRSLESGGKM